MRIPGRAAHTVLHTRSTECTTAPDQEKRRLCARRPDTPERTRKSLLGSPFRGSEEPLSTSSSPVPLPTRRCPRAPVTAEDLDHSWRRIRAELRTAVSDATWQLYLDALDARRLDGSTLVLMAPDASRAWITERFSRLLQAASQRVLGPDVAVRLVPPDDPVAIGEAPATRSPWTAADVPFNPRFTFDQFVIG